MQLRLGRQVFAAAAAAAGLAVLCAASQAQATYAPNPSPALTALRWRIARVVSNSPGVVNLFQVTAVSASDLWAAGGVTPELGADSPILEHWGGRAWRNWTPPVAGMHLADSDLTAIGSSSRTNVWALGTSNGQSYALRWNGRFWKKFSFGKAIDMTAVAVLSRTDVWVFGRPAGQAGQPFAERFDGTAWHATSPPGFGDSVSAVSGTDIWAVGAKAGSTALGPLVVSHWVGGSWQAVALPAVGKPGDVLASPNIFAGSGSGGWVDAEVMARGGVRPLYPVLLHLTGSAWQVHRCPIGFTDLGQITSDGRGVWIVAGSGWPRAGYFMHFGGRWTWHVAAKPANALDPVITALVRIPGSSWMLAAGILPYQLGGSGIIYEYAR